MKATGIVRRIDDLGRVVVPKEIRRTLRIREGDPLEIYTDREGGIILRKYSPIGELSQFSKQYAEALAQNTGYIVSITDRDRHIATAGSGKKELMQKEISRQLDNLMNQRENLLAVKGERKFISITEDGGENYTAQVIYPIIAEGDAIGTVILTTKDEKVRMGEMEMKLAGDSWNNKTGVGGTSGTGKVAENIISLILACAIAIIRKEIS